MKDLMPGHSLQLSRRQMLRQSAQAAAWLGLAAHCAPLFGAPEQRRFKIGACDWSIGKMDNPEAFAVAKQIGLDGVQVSLGTAANNMRLRHPEVQKRCKDAAQAAGLEVASRSEEHTSELQSLAYLVCRL